MKCFKFNEPDELNGWCTWLRRGDFVVLNERRSNGLGYDIFHLKCVAWMVERTAEQLKLRKLLEEIGNDFILQLIIVASILPKQWHNGYVRHLLYEWCAKSPDLNLIENVWDKFAKYFYDKPNLAKEDQRWKGIKDAKRWQLEI